MADVGSNLNRRDIHGQKCLFYGMVASQFSMQQTKKCDIRILGLGEDLIVKEEKYHNTCR